jgi:hypothetical protein
LTFGPHLPAILMTGFAGEATGLALGGQVEGAYSLLRKPVAGLEMAERIAVLLEGSAVAASRSLGGMTDGESSRGPPPAVEQ